MYACLRCFKEYSLWLAILMGERCSACGARLEEILTEIVLSEY